MVLLLGTEAYSPFRMDAIRETIARFDPELGPLEIDARWVYALELTDEAFDVVELERAASLLGAEGDCDAADFFVTPRKGTISPWSSKATDIFRNCGIKSIRRVERGVRYIVSLAKPRTAAEQDEFKASLSGAKWLAALYDKMTEGVYDDLSDLFDVADPQPGRTYDVKRLVCEFKRIHPARVNV